MTDKLPQAIYEPKGRAAEYAELACNIYDGCTHGCLYCYVPRVLRRRRCEFVRWHAQPRTGILEALERDAKRMAERGDKRRVLFSFTSDPYQWAAQTHGTTRRALQILGEYGIPASVLTKAGPRATSDCALMREYGTWFGSTLTFTPRRWHDSDVWEPHAYRPSGRQWAIKEAKRYGLFAWVSLEPVLDPADALAWIDRLGDTVDLWRVGKWNYAAGADAHIDWQAFAQNVYEALRATGASYLIKRDLAEYLPDSAEMERWVHDA